MINVYPSFKLGDAETTQKVLVKNLVCACTGLPRQDLEWIFEFKNATPESTLALLGTMQPTSKFGEVFQYSNLMAAAAGYIGAHLVYPNQPLGIAYDEAMQKKIFDPLGMKSTTFDYARALAGNHASPHGDDVDGKPSVASMAFNYSVVPARPAGGVLDLGRRSDPLRAARACAGEVAQRRATGFGSYDFRDAEERAETLREWAAQEADADQYEIPDVQGSIPPCMHPGTSTG